MRRQILIAAAALLAASCGRQRRENGPIRDYRLQGEIVRISEPGRLVAIRHETITGAGGAVWMPAMTMDFPVRDAGEFERLRPGQKIHARVRQDEKSLDFWIDQIQIAAAEAPAQP